METAMTAFLYVYLGGIALRAFITHGIVQNPNCQKASVDGQMLGHIFWPFVLVAHIFKR